MADQKISQLSSGAPAQAGDEYVVARSGANYKLTLTNIAASMPPIGATTPNTGAFTTLTNGLGAVGTPSYTFTSDLNTGMWSPAADTVAWSTGGSERMRIDSSGNVGIGGTASDWARLAARGTFPTSSNVSQIIEVRGTIPSGSTTSAYSFNSNLTTQAASFTCSNVTHFRVDALTIGAGSTVTNQYGFVVPSGHTTATNNYGFYSDIASGSNRWNFYAAGTANNYFAGSLGIGISPTNHTGYRLVVDGVVTGNAALFITSGGAAAPVHSQWHKATSGDNWFTDFYTEASPTLRGSITYNRAGGVVAYNTTSDYRAKDVFGAWDNAGTTIDALKVYRGKMHGATLERPMMIAHEAQAVVPYAVGGEKDAVDKDGKPVYQTMDHQILVPLLIAELQAVRARLAALEAK